MSKYPLLTTGINFIVSFVIFYLLLTSLIKINSNNEKNNSNSDSNETTNITEINNIIDDSNFYNFSYLSEIEEKFSQKENQKYNNFISETNGTNSKTNRAKIIIPFSLSLNIIGIGTAFVLLFSFWVENKRCCCEGERICYCCCCECTGCACCHCNCECHTCNSCVNCPYFDAGGDNPIIGIIFIIIFIGSAFVGLFYATYACGKYVSRSIAALMQIIINIIILILNLLCHNTSISDQTIILVLVLTLLLIIINGISLRSSKNRFCHCCSSKMENYNMNDPMHNLAYI